MGTLSLADLGKTRKLHQGLPSQEERVKFKQEVVIGRDGIYLSYLSDFFDIVYRTEQFDNKTQKVLSGVGVPEVQQGLTISEKIPSGMIHRMVAWYRHINEKHGTEATMQVFYDKTEGDTDFPQEMKDTYEGSIKRDGKFVFVIPEQNVTGGHVTFDGDQFPTQMTKELYDWAISHYEPVLNIHSHNHMSAFWSAEDDKNELPLYTRLCLVIGKVDTAKPMFRFSWNFEGKRHHYESTIDTFIEPLERTTTIEGLGYEVKKEMGFDEALGYIDYDALEFDERWDERIKARGRYGVNRGVFKPLHELKSEDYQMTPEQTRVAKDLAVNGNYAEGVLPSLEEFEDEESEQEDLLQDEFFQDAPIQGFLGDDISTDGSDDEETIFSDTWKNDLQKHKEKLVTSNEDKDNNETNVREVPGVNANFRTSHTDKNSNSAKQGSKVYEKFKRDQIRNEKHTGRNPHKGGRFW